MNVQELKEILELLERIKKLQSEVFGHSEQAESEEEEEITPIEGKGASG